MILEARMVKRPALVEAIEADFKERLPDYHKSRREGLAALAGVMLETRSANLMELAAALPREIDAARGNPAQLTRVTAYIAGVENWPRFNAVYAEMLGDCRPARIVVPVVELHHGCLVEIDAIGVVK